jgi:hypothetical protein
MKKLILIHGRAQGGKEKPVLKKLWADTLGLGLRAGGITQAVADAGIVFPFYGDLLDDLVRQVNEPVEDILQRGTANPVDAAFFNEFLEEVAGNAKIDMQEIQAAYPAGVVERSPLNWKWVHAILRAIDRKNGWGELAIKKFTYDVFLYLTNPHVRKKIDSVVLEAMPQEPCVVVAHSLGTIVAYNVLRDHPELQVHKFITLGSPLGLQAVKKYLKPPVSMPECVKNGWFNAFDAGDVVALNPLEPPHFSIAPATVTNKNDVRNQTDNQHGIEGYLNNDVVAKEIFNALMP